KRRIGIPERIVDVLPVVVPIAGKGIAGRLLVDILAADQKVAAAVSETRAESAGNLVGLGIAYFGFAVASRDLHALVASVEDQVHHTCYRVCAISCRGASSHHLRAL